jgi:hypothetical protein
MCAPTLLAAPAQGSGRKSVFPPRSKNASAQAGENVRQAKALPCAGDRKKIDK